jgi:nucleotidyltransferase/DNA polymerase involved in DNA repair
MERYSIEPAKLSLERFFELTRSKKLIPSRITLHHKTGERFRLLASLGIENLAQLIGALGNKKKMQQVASSTGIPLEILVLLKREAGSYMAKPFPLSDFPGIPYEFTEVLKSRGIRNTRDFFEKVQSSAQRREVSTSTGIPESRLQEIYSLCDLSRITGVGGLYARIIFEAGISSTLDFANTNAATHNEKYLKVIEKYAYPAKPLGEDDIRYCIDYAKVILEMMPGS